MLLRKNGVLFFVLAIFAIVAILIAYKCAIELVADKMLPDIRGSAVSVYNANNESRSNGAIGFVFIKDNTPKYLIKLEKLLGKSQSLKYRFASVTITKDTVILKQIGLRNYPAELKDLEEGLRIQANLSTIKESAPIQAHATTILILNQSPISF